MDSKGIITTVVGGGQESGDGARTTEAKLSTPRGLFIDGSGNLFISDYTGARIRKVEGVAAPTTLKIGIFAPEPPPPVTVTTAKSRAVVVAIVTQNGSPVAGTSVAFSRSVSGWVADYRWRGTTNTSGLAQVEIVADSPILSMANASGYYSARATDATGAVVGIWMSIPINGGKETTLTLPVGGMASIEGTRLLNTSSTLGLYANYPNPFNPTTQIAYELPEAGEMRLVIYNALGQEVRALVQGKQEAGYYRVTWDGKDAVGRQVSSGLYFYRLTSGGFAETRKMMLLK